MDGERKPHPAPSSPPSQNLIPRLTAVPSPEGKTKKETGKALMDDSEEPEEVKEHIEEPEEIGVRIQ